MEKYHPASPNNMESKEDYGDNQTVEIPLSACPDCKEGDALGFKVVSVDQNSGTITMTPTESESPEAPEEQGSDKLAQRVGEDEASTDEYA